MSSSTRAPLPNFYGILELPEDASKVDIRKSWIRLSRITHPDKVQGQGEHKLECCSSYRLKAILSAMARILQTSYRQSPAIIPATNPPTPGSASTVPFNGVNQVHGVVTGTRGQPRAPPPPRPSPSTWPWDNMPTDHGGHYARLCRTHHPLEPSLKIEHDQAFAHDHSYPKICLCGNCRVAFTARVAKTLASLKIMHAQLLWIMENRREWEGRVPLEQRPETNGGFDLFFFMLEGVDLARERVEKAVACINGISVAGMDDILWCPKCKYPNAAGRLSRARKQRWIVKKWGLDVANMQECLAKLATDGKKGMPFQSRLWNLFEITVRDWKRQLEEEAENLNGDYQ
ncbi:hypothetical protein B0T16DRAFT_391450 [Cercophora newfieldiana]|uniref:J domain-containing protein n=1 Tax=Cercophora newfieldiana TaxID=92897 RepID=A0AA39Y6W7_9PEZI|nr:hypothetical protein B0T16DRAFT_391450 [Cercophora newfieldiana]